LGGQLHQGVADDVLRDVYVRAEYRNMVLPMTVIRRDCSDNPLSLWERVRVRASGG